MSKNVIRNCASNQSKEVKKMGEKREKHVGVSSFVNKNKSRKNLIGTRAMHSVWHQWKWLILMVFIRFFLQPLSTTQCQSIEMIKLCSFLFICLKVCFKVARHIVVFDRKTVTAWYTHRAFEYIIEIVFFFCSTRDRRFSIYTHKLAAEWVRRNQRKIYFRQTIVLRAVPVPILFPSFQ